MDVLNYVELGVTVCGCSNGQTVKNLNYQMSKQLSTIGFESYQLILYASIYYSMV